MDVINRLHAKLTNIGPGERLPIAKKEFELYWQVLLTQNKTDLPFFAFKDREGEQSLIGFDIHQESTQRPAKDSTIWIGGESFSSTAQQQAPHWQDFGKALYIAPLWGIMHYRDDYYLYLQGEIASDLQTFYDFFELAPIDPNQQLQAQEQEERPGRQDWQQMIESALKTIEQTDLKKVVLAREKKLALDFEQTHAHVLRTLALNCEESFLFYFRPRANRAFLSVTPERLFAFDHDTQQITTDVIAGTHPRATDYIEDDKLAQELLMDPKELAEHRFVKTEIENCLQEFGKVRLICEEKILKLKHVQHIHGRYQVELKKAVNYTQLIDSLHPTPAVGGTPKKLAAQSIRELESFERGWYAAPVGIITPEATQYAVAIRSALFYGDQIHIFAGAGIVPGSQAESEWQETENKMLNFIEHLVPKTPYHEKTTTRELNIE